MKKIDMEIGDIQLSNGVYFVIDKVEPNNKFIDGNEIYFRIYNSYNAYSPDIAYCSALANNDLDKVFYYIDKVTYLDNGDFSVEKAIETITYRDLEKEFGNNFAIKQEDGTFDCSLQGQYR